MHISQLSILRSLAPVLCAAVFVCPALQAQSKAPQANPNRKVEIVRSPDISTEVAYPQDKDGNLLSVHATPNGTAPALSAVFVANVCSATAACEQISSGQLLSSLTHGGSYIDVYVWEIGYGVGETAKQGGVQLSNSYLVDYRPVCNAAGGGYTVNCPNGSTIVGYRYVWNVAFYVETYGSNPFTAQDPSSVPPYNSCNTTLTIKH